jgi:hypothetical protein
MASNANLLQCSSFPSGAQTRPILSRAGPFTASLAYTHGRSEAVGARRERALECRGLDAFDEHQAPTQGVVAERQRPGVLLG